jgi:chromosome segregation protein
LFFREEVITLDVMDKGAHFFKCDFQIHTPRDLNWKGKDAATAAERKDYAEEFISAARQKGLHAVAVTDHAMTRRPFRTPA